MPTAAPPEYDTSHTYTAATAYDAAGRPLHRELPRDPDWDLFRANGDTSSAPTVVGRMRYDARGLPTATSVQLWQGAPASGSLLHAQGVLTHAEYDAYNAPRELWLRASDPAERLTQSFAYDVRHRPRAVRVERGGNTVTGMPGTLNAVPVPFHEVYDFDRSNNLVGTTSYAGPGALPAGRRALRRTIAQDSLYRVAQVSMEYQQDDLTWSAHDAASDWRSERGLDPDAPGALRGDGETNLRADPMRSRPSPMVAPLPQERVQDLMYEYDWLANMTLWDDDAQSFHERSLGRIGNGADADDAEALRPSALYLASNLPETEVAAASFPANAGWLDLDYGQSGNVVAVTVRAQCTHVDPTSGTGGKCVDDPNASPSAREAALLAGCACASEQHFQYRWDELNRLSEARRYDRTTGPGTDWSLAARQRYLYDGANVRVVKQTLGMAADAPSETRAGLSVPTERVHLYVMPGDYERVGVVPDRSVPTAPTYQGSVDLGTESEYGVAGTKLVWKPGSDLSGLERDRRLTMPIGDLLGTASAVVDLDSGAMTEMATFYPNGGREMHWMSEDASLARERNAFTGKEEDEEVGVTYFGERYLVQRVGRWATPDPLSIHAMGGGEAGNAYQYVGGNALQARDDIGLSRRVMITPGSAMVRGSAEASIYPDARRIGEAWAAADPSRRTIPLVDSRVGIQSAILMAMTAAGPGGEVLMFAGHGLAGGGGFQVGSSTISASDIRTYEQASANLKEATSVLSSHALGGPEIMKTLGEIARLRAQLSAGGVGVYADLVREVRGRSPAANISRLTLVACEVGGDPEVLSMMGRHMNVTVSAPAVRLVARRTETLGPFSTEPRAEFGFQPSVVDPETGEQRYEIQDRFYPDIPYSSQYMAHATPQGDVSVGGGAATEPVDASPSKK